MCSLGINYVWLYIMSEESDILVYFSKSIGVKES